MQTYLLPLPASPETAEELTAFVRDTFFAFLRENKFCSFSHSVNSGLRFPSRLFYFARVIFCGKEKWNKCKHFLLPLPPSPETAEELTAFARYFFCVFARKNKFCSFFHPESMGKRNGINTIRLYYLSLPLLKQQRS
jgi:hypothetical protein